MGELLEELANTNNFDFDKLSPEAKQLFSYISGLQHKLSIANHQSEENYEKYTDALKNINQLKDSIKRLTKSRNKFRKKYYKLLNGEQDGKR